MVASRGGNGAVTVMVYRTLIFDDWILIPHCPSPIPRPNDVANSDSDDDDEYGEVILSTLLLL